MREGCNLLPNPDVELTLDRSDGSSRTSPYLRFSQAGPLNGWPASESACGATGRFGGRLGPPPPGSITQVETVHRYLALNRWKGVKKTAKTREGITKDGLANPQNPRGNSFRNNLIRDIQLTKNPGTLGGTGSGAPTCLGHQSHSCPRRVA